MPGTDPGWACAQTVNQLFRCLDENRSADGAALFLEDGVWTKRGVPISGRDAIQASMESRGPTVASRHLVTNMIVEPDGAEMIARYYVTTFADEAYAGGVAKLALPVAILVCEDRLAETPQGWRFASRSSRPVFAQG